MASSSSDCSRLFEEVQNKLDSTMPWIGLYIAAATALCSLAMAADAFIGFRSKSIAPISRWFIALTIKVTDTQHRSFRDELKVDKYWTLKLVEWRDTSIPLRVQNRLCKKLLCDVRRFVLNFCIGFQIFFFYLANYFYSSLLYMGEEFICLSARNLRGLRDGAQLDFSQYALLLEGEPQLPSYIVKNICNEEDESSEPKIVSLSRILSRQPSPR